MLDDDFIKRVCRTTAVVLAVALIWSLGFRKYLIAGGLLYGASIGMVALWNLDRIVRRAFVPGTVDSGKTLTKYAFVKYPMFALLLVPVVFSRSLTFILAFIAGMLLTHAVIFLKAVGLMINQRMKA